MSKKTKRKHFLQEDNNDPQQSFSSALQDIYEDLDNVPRASKRDCKTVDDAQILMDSDEEFNSEEDDFRDYHLSDLSDFEEEESDISTENPLNGEDVITTENRLLEEGSEVDDSSATSLVRTPSSKFSFVNPGQKSIPFTGTPGLQQACGENPIDFFRLLFTKKLAEHIVLKTNIYANELSKLSSKKRSRIKAWKPLTVEELDKFLGVLYLMGQIKLPSISMYWKKSKLYNFPTISKVMSRDRFQNILRSLCFGCRGDPQPQDPLYKIRPLLDLFYENMTKVYYPKRELSLDEPISLWRGRLYFRQYIPNNKCGIKLYTLTQANGLVLKIIVYAGSKDPDVGGPGHSSKVVRKLLEDFSGKGHIVYMDNFYNSVPLAKELLGKNTYVTGTLRKSRKGNPTEVISKKLQKKELVQKFSPQGICVMKFNDKRDILMLSSEYDGTKVPTTVKGKMIEKPQMILDYNKFMGGIDRSDQLMTNYPIERQTLRWSAKLGIHIFHVILNNSHILFTQTTKKIPLLQFRDQIINELVGPEKESKICFQSRIHLPSKTINSKSRKRCIVCTSKQIRKDTMYSCQDCPKQPGLCLEPCFRIHHNYA